MVIEGKRFGVIGGAGLVGSHVVDSLLAENAAQVTVFGSLRQRDNLAQASQDSRLKLEEGYVTDSLALRRVLEGVDGVFLLSSLWMSECAENPHKAIEVNIGGTLATLEACRNAGVSRLVYASSASVYGHPTIPVMTEEHPLNNGTFYGATKIAAEQFLRAYHEMYGLAYITCRYTNVYGPRQTAKGASASVVIRTLDRIAAGQPPIIFGDGSQGYDFIYVQDVAQANILAMRADVTDEIVNISSGVSTSINELVYTLLQLTGSDLQPEYRPNEKSSTQFQTVSNEKAERLLGFHAQTALVDGLRQLIHWRQIAVQLTEQA